MPCSHRKAPSRRNRRDGYSIGRRRFVQLVAGAAGWAAFLGIAPGAARAGEADALLLSCMDYRLIDDLVRFMAGKGMTDKYDHVILAGAAAGAVHEKFADWHKTFWSHLAVAIDLHKIHKVIIVDYRDCGAYKIALGPDHAKDRATETAAHAAIIGTLVAEIRKRHPSLAIESYLMALDGTTEAIKT